MNDRLSFVQFLHPGPEATPDAGGMYVWNQGPEHRRRFIRQRGNYLDSSSRLHEDREIVFWGEWEAQGDAEEIPQEQRIPFGPNSFCSPWYQPLGRQSRNGGCGTENTGCMNTDPFVFGERFLYSNCRQYSNERLTRLQGLLPGSVILFGSRINHRFCLDTVLVIEEGTPYRLHENRAMIAERTSQTFMDVTADYIHPNLTLMLYEGRRYDPAEPDTPFSFVPCRPFNAEQYTFARPVIELEGFIRPGMTQGFNTNQYRLSGDPGQLQDLWYRVRKQVIEQQLCLGVCFNLPERRS